MSGFNFVIKKFISVSRNYENNFITGRIHEEYILKGFAENAER